MLNNESREVIGDLEQVLDQLSPKDRTFAESLMHSCRTQRSTPSMKQLFWLRELHKRACSPRPEPTKAAVGDLSGVTELFDRAKQHLKRPAIVLSADLTGDETGEEVRLSLAPANGRNAGAIYVQSTGRWEDRDYYGKIAPGGTFVESLKKPDAIKTDKLVALLRRFATDPAKVAAEHGRLTGKCCFCNSGLKDERSTSVGYGPVCADHFGLPWGARASVFDEETAVEARRPATLFDCTAA